MESALLRSYNSGTRAAPYESLVLADIGDVNVNVYDLKDTCRRIRETYRKVLASGCIPLTMGECAYGTMTLFFFYNVHILCQWLFESAL